MLSAPQAAKPTPEQRLMAELEVQRNAAMTQSARLGAELMAVRDALDEALAEIDELTFSVTDKE